MPKAKTRMLRKAIEINENINFNNLKTKNLDELVDFVVELYGNKLNEFLRTFRARMDFKRY